MNHHIEALGLPLDARYDLRPLHDSTLGPSDRWSGELRLAVQLTLDAQLPSFLLWGENRTIVCNEAFRTIDPEKHADVFGTSAVTTWPELSQSSRVLFDRPNGSASYSVRGLQLIESEPQRTFDCFYTCVENSGGERQGVMCTVIETMKMQGADPNFQTTEERLRLAQAAGGIGTFEWIPATGEIIGSPTYNQIWGFEVEARLDLDRLIELVDPADLSLLGNAIDVNRVNPLAYAEYRFRRADTGEKRWLARRGEIVGDSVTTPRRFVGIAFDITERKMIEEALTKTELEVNERNAFIKLLLDSTEEGFYSVDQNGATTLCNRAFLRMLGYTSETEVIGRKLNDQIHPFHGDGTPYLANECPIFRTAETGEAAHIEDEWFQRVDGSRFPVEYRVRPIWREGQLQGALCTFSDITERVDSVNQLRILNETLEYRVIEEIDRRARAEEALHQSQKMEAIGQLTGGVAHDFNNVLQIIGGNLQLLQTEIGAESPFRKRIDTATVAVNRGAKLSTQLLAFARRQPLRPIVINLGRLVQNMNDLLRRALGESILIETTIAEGLWNTLADPSQLENVILNLAINSRDAVADRIDGHLIIELGNVMLDASQITSKMHNSDSLPVGEYVLLAVSDNGTGMTPDVLQKAFEPFFTTKAEGTGTGLGLSMAYGFVKQSHGHIKIYSEAGQGTTIRIYLPRSQEAEAVIPDTSTDAVVRGSETILVVEDDPGVQTTVVDTLVTLGYNVLKADDGASALNILKSGKPIDLLFTDVVMPGPVRSPDLARQARELIPSIAVLFTSGYTQNAIVHGGRLDPGVDLLSKPYRRDELARKIRRSLADAGGSLPKKMADPAVNPAKDDADSGEETSLRILVVEDNPDLCQLVCELLENFGYVVAAAVSAEEAIPLIGQQAFDVLLTDVQLPGISGIDLARQALASRPEMHVIFASGYGPSATANFEFPAYSLAKPYDIEKLHALLESIQAGLK